MYRKSIYFTTFCYLCSTGTNNECVPINENSIPSNYIRDFMDLDEFLATTTTVLESCDSKRDFCPSLIDCTNLSRQTSTDYDDEEEDACVRDYRLSNSTDEEHIQEIQNMGEYNNINGNPVSTAVNQRNGHIKSNKTAAKDKKYWDRRLKNNVAAKRSRGAKRHKETSLMERWKLLEDENTRLKTEISNVKEQVETIEHELNVTSSEKIGTSNV